jgi:hypothetical protein
MNRVSLFTVSLTLRTTTCPPALRQRPVPPVIAKHTGRLVEGKTLDGQLVAAKTCGDHALEGGRRVLEADEGAHPAADADLVAVAEQVLAEHAGVAERGLVAGGGDIHVVGLDLDGSEVQDLDVVGVGGGEGGEAQGGGGQGA